MKYNFLKGLNKSVISGGLVVLLASLGGQYLKPEFLLQFVPDQYEQLTLAGLMGILLAWLRNYLKVRFNLPL